MLEMHPSELKNIALAAAAVAEREGFTGTAEAWAQIARMCAQEAIACNCKVLAVGGIDLQVLLLHPRVC